MIILNNRGTKQSTWEGYATSSKLQKFYQSMGGKKKIASLPICPKCESVGLRDKGWQLDKTMMCPHCGYSGKTIHQYSAYVKDALYK